MIPTTSHIPLRSFSCVGCDCGACTNDAITAIQQIDGVVHARIDRRRTSVVVRHDPDIVDEAMLKARITESRLHPH